MASRVVSYWRSVVSHTGATRGLTTSTPPKMKSLSLAVDNLVEPSTKPRALRGDFVPVYVALGLIVMSMSLGLHAAKQQLAYAPGVWVSKKRRETIPEVVEPDYVATKADKFVKKSLFRRMAQVQEGGPTQLHRQVISKKVETLKSVGVEPSRP